VLTLAWGDLPADLPVQPVIRRGQPAQVLVEAAAVPVTCWWWGPAAAAP